MLKAAPKKGIIIYSIGHSTRPIGEFIALLKEFGVTQLADVRSFPASRTNPQFNSDTLAASLIAEDIMYEHIRSLGGLKSKQSPQSQNKAWRHTNFRNYADYAETATFREGLERLISLGRERPTAYMCAEALWWKCHRRIITDYVLVEGFDARHIMAPGKAEPAMLNEDAMVANDGTITYPGAQHELGLE